MKPATQVCWMRSPLWDVSLLALGWIPFYVWVASNSVGKNSWFGDASAGFTAAVAVALALNFAHRQYVFILVYGDRETAAERPRGYVIAPLVALFVVCGAFWSENRALQLAVLGVLGIWNAWHVIQQRYGLMRVYAGRARGGLESRAAARADRALVWSSVLVMICATAWGHAGMLEGVPQAALLLSVIGPLLTGPIVKSALAAALLVWGVVFWRWLRIERRSTPLARWPRWIFGLSTLALLAIFVVHGPVVGYLVLGVAHSLEYLAFVYQFSEKKYQRGTNSVAALLLGSMGRAPIVLFPLLVAYVFLYEHRYALAYVTYYTTTSILHYLYDGWIWKLRSARVARPLEAST
ncbi:MAG TPA: hypothetical protein VK524_18860 [Polyangiaceae bacterium]|nr:hypothetical protein [Polyangiaceae bacterium]